MKRIHSLASAALLALAAAVQPAAAAGFSTDSETSIGALYFGWWGQGSVIVDCIHIPDGVASPCGSGPRQAEHGPSWTDVGYALATANPSPGLLSGTTETWRRGTAPGGFDTRGGGGASIRTTWTDTFTITSSTLAAGTPVQLRFTVDLDAQLMSPPDLGACSIGGTGGCANATASLHWGAPGGAWIASASARTPRMGEGSALILSANPGIGFLDTSVGATFSLGGQLTLSANVQVNSADLFSASADGSALFGIEVMTAGAGFLADSGYAYALTPVPEPAAWWLMLAGAPALWLAGRRRRA